MTTSLANQLKQLKAKAPFVQTLPGSDHTRASILFEPGEAAKYDRETIYELGVSGLDELIAIDAERFSRYEDTLFSRGSITIERTTQNQEVNAALDADIRRFLVDVSPYLLLSASRRTLEWLIHRYRIHEFNVEDLITTTLLYHDTALFVTVLKLMMKTIEEPTNKWNWIYNCAKNGVPLTRTVLLNHCRKDVGFLSLVCSNAFTHIEILGSDSPHVRLAVGMFSVAALGVLENRADVSERVLGTLLPLIERGIRSRCTDLRAAACMVFAQCTVVVTLENKVVNTLLEKLTKHMAGRLIREAICCMSIVVRNQKIEKLSKKCLRHIWRVPSLSSLLSSLSKQFDLSALMRLVAVPLVAKAVAAGTDLVAMTTDESDAEEGGPQYFEILVGLLEGVSMCGRVSACIIREILAELVNKRQQIKKGGEKHSAWQHCARRLLSIMDRRMTSALETSFSDLQKDESQMNVLEELSTLTLMPVKYSLVPDLHTNLLLGLGHARSVNRFYATRHLVNLLVSGEHAGLGLTADFISDKLLERLDDEDMTVVGVVLDMSEKLVDFVDAGKLGQSLLKLIGSHSNQSEWAKLVDKATVILCSNRVIVGGSESIVYELLPWLLLTSSDAHLLKRAGLILQCVSEAHSVPLFNFLNTKGLLEQLDTLLADVGEVSDETLGRFNWCVIHDLARSLSAMNEEDYKLSVDNLTRLASMSSQQRFLSAIVMTMSLSLSKGSHNGGSLVTRRLDTITRVIAVLRQERYKKEKHILGNDDAQTTSGKKSYEEQKGSENIRKWLRRLLKSERLPLSFVLHSLDMLLASLKKFKIKDVQWTSSSEPYVAAVYSLVQLCVENLTGRTRNGYLVKLDQMLDKQSVLKIATLVWCQQLQSVYITLGAGVQTTVLPSSQLIIACVGIVQRISAAHLAAVSDVMIHAVLPCLLVLLYHSADSDVRHSICECLVTLAKTSSSDGVGFKHARLVKRLSKKREELSADGAYVTEVMCTVYSGVDEADPSLQALLQCLTEDSTPVYMRVGLLDLLATTRNRLVVKSIVSLGLSTLTQVPLRDLDLVILKHSLARLDSEAASQISGTDDPVISLLVKALSTSGDGAGTENHEGEWEKMEVEGSTERVLSPQTLTAEMIGRKFFHALPSVEIQRYIVTALINTHQRATDSKTVQSVLTCLKKLKLNYLHLKSELEAGLAVESKATPKGRKRVSTAKTRAPLDYRRLSAVLDIVQCRRQHDSIDMVTTLFSLLSRLVLDDEAANQEACDYCKQVTLTSIYNMCVGWRDGLESDRPKQPEILNMDALVECIRGSLSPQTQRQALLVVTSVAPLFPDYILHSVMPVFTFMGTSLIQRDDSHSFQVILQTIDSVIPAIVQAHSAKDSAVAMATKRSDLQATVISILRVFVDARHHVPLHRRLPLFTRLLTTVGIGTNLWRLHVLTMESAVRTRPVVTSTVVNEGAKSEVRDGQQEFSDERQAVIGRDIELAVSVSGEFSAYDQLMSVVHVIEFLQQLLSVHSGVSAAGNTKSQSADSLLTLTPGGKRKFTPTSTGKRRKVDVGAGGEGHNQEVIDLDLINVGSLSAQQVRLLQYHLSRLVTSVLSNRQLITQILNLPVTLVGSEISSHYGGGDSEVKGNDVASSHSEIDGKDRAMDLSAVFKRLVDETLCYMTHVNRLCGAQTTGGDTTCSAGEGASGAVGKFWKALLQRIYEILDKVNYLLPSSSFLDVVTSLLSHASSSVRHKSMDLLNNKLQNINSIESLNENEITRLLALVERLLNVIRSDDDSTDNDVVANRQMALYSIKLLCRLLAAAHPQSFTPIFSVSVQVLRDSTCVALQCNALLCIAELCSSLRAHSIQHLPVFMPPLLNAFNNKDFLQSELALVCVTTTLLKVVSSLPHFISPYLVKLIVSICDLDSTSLIENCSKRALVNDKFLALCRQLATLVSSRVFIPNITTAYGELLQSNQKGLVMLMSLLRQHLEAVVKEDLSAQQPLLVQFFCQTLDIRNTVTKLDRSEMDRCEDSVIETILSLVIRLSENSFRPMFYKLYDYSCREDDAMYRNRRLTFYRLCERLSARLKSVFILFVGHIVKSACQALEANNDSKTDEPYYSGADSVYKSCQLISQVLGCLQKCLLFDSSHTFVDAYTSAIMQPIIDQLDNFIGGNEAYQTRVDTHLVPCLAQLAVAARETSAWKSLNYQVCLKTRHPLPKVRFATLRVIEQMAVKLGDGYEALLPETMPFLAELLEDDSEEVEQECQRVKVTLEELLGESLGKYF